MKNLLLITLVLIGLTTMAQVPFYIVDSQTNTFELIDSTTFNPNSLPKSLTASTGIVDGCTGLSIRPCTGEFYVSYKANASRYLGIIDTATAVITEIGDMGDNVAGICFGDNNQLYAVTGDGATTPETLYKVDLGNGTMTLFVTLGNGDDGECIAFCKDNSSIYHWSGIGAGGVIMEKIDTVTGTITNIPLSGFGFSEVFGATYIGNGAFLINHISGSYVRVDTSGLAVDLGGSAGGSYKGIAFPITPNIPNVNINPSPSTFYCIGDSVLLTGSSGGSSQWYLNGSPIPGANSNTYYASSPGVYNMTKTNLQGCSDSSAVGTTVVSDPCVGIKEIGNNSFSFYPNPASTHLTIDSKTAIIRLEIIDITGKTIKSFTPKNNTINVADIPSGIYFIKLIGENNTVSKKFVKN